MIKMIIGILLVSFTQFIEYIPFPLTPGGISGGILVIYICICAGGLLIISAMSDAIFR